MQGRPQARQHPALQRRVRFTREAEAQLPCNQRRDAGKGVQQPLIQTAAGLGCVQQADEFGCVRFGWNALILPGRIVIEQAGQDLPQLGHFKVHAPQAVENASVRAGQDQIGIAAHQLQDQLLAARNAHLVGAVKNKGHAALCGRLGDLRQTAAGQMLAQQHTEHGRLRRIFKGSLRQMDARAVDIGRKQQPAAAISAAQMQQDGVARGLLDLIDPAAGERQKLLPDGAEKNGIKGHRVPP